jgi:hypothetical protein
MQQQRRRQQLRDDGHRPGAGASPAGLDERRHARCSRPQAGHGNAGGVFTQHLAIAVSLQRVLWNPKAFKRRRSRIFSMDSYHAESLVKTVRLTCSISPSFLPCPGATAPVPGAPISAPAAPYPRAARWAVPPLMATRLVRAPRGAPTDCRIRTTTRQQQARASPGDTAARLGPAPPHWPAMAAARRRTTSAVRCCCRRARAWSATSRRGRGTPYFARAGASTARAASGRITRPASAVSQRQGCGSRRAARAGAAAPAVRRRRRSRARRTTAMGALIALGLWRGSGTWWTYLGAPGVACPTDLQHHHGCDGGAAADVTQPETAPAWRPSHNPGASSTVDRRRCCGAAAAGCGRTTPASASPPQPCL